MIRILTVLLLATLSATPAAQAHELWIEPEEFATGTSAPIAAHIRVGENFKGAPLSWLPRRFDRAEVLQGTNRYALTSRLGDRPALHTTVDQPGLVTLVIETAPTTLTYREWEKFQNFVAHKDFKTALADHKARGLPETPFAETYTRHVKSLIAVGEGAGADQTLGLQTEITALMNPYTDDLSNGLRVRVDYLDAPRADTQVEVFEKSGDTVNVFTTRTDAMGIAVIPVKPGHTYLLDAVVLRDTGAMSTAEGPVWETLWAGLSFATPSE